MLESLAGALVMGTSTFGVRVWKLKIHACRDEVGWHRSWSFVPQADALQTLHIVDVSEWVSVKMTAKSPFALKQMLPEAARGNGICLVTSDTPKPLVKASAEHGFKGINMKYLLLLAAIVKLPAGYWGRSSIHQYRF